MRVLFASHEVEPFAKVGGLADVAGSLPRALRERGHDVRVLMPAYRMVLEEPTFRVQPALKHSFGVHVGPGWFESASLWETCLPHSDVPVWLLGGQTWFRDTISSATVYQPGFEQHLFFARAALEACRQMGWIPDIVHANDWHTGYLPVFLKGEHDPLWDGVASAFTIHNLAYQGEFGIEVLERAGLPLSMFNHHELEAYGRVNFLKAGCAFADQVNTVSERYAQEIQTPEYGCRLDGLMRHLAFEGRLSGILNGIDQQEFNPASDPHIPAHFTPDDLSGKRQCKEALLAELQWSADPALPLFGVVSRLSGQKGMDVLLRMVDRLLDAPSLLVVQGLGDPWLAEQFRALAGRRADRFRFVERFDAPFAQRVYAGSDLFLMPSAFEPCGLGQQIAMRYGTIPIVRETGGLADTVTEGENGFVFGPLREEPLWLACERALTAYRGPDWLALVRRAMAYDSSWTRSAAAYETMYARALEYRHTRAQASVRG